MSVSIIVASGKGGVGKSTLTANLGAALASRGATAVIVDADIGLRAQDALLGLQDRVVYDLVDVAGKDCALEQALIASPGYPGLSLLPASRKQSHAQDRHEQDCPHRPSVLIFIP